MQLHLTNIMSNKEYKRRNNELNKRKYREQLKEEGKATKKEQLEELRQKIKAFKAKGFKNNEITQELDIPIKTLERHITYMKKNGLL